MREAGYGTRHAHTLVRVVVNARRVGTRAVEEHLRRGAGRCLLAEVDGGRLAVGEADHHKAAAADVAGGGVGDGQREPGGDGGVNGVAAVGQHIAPSLTGNRAGRDDHALRGVDGGAWGPDGSRFLRAEGKGKDGAGQPETGGHASGQGGEGHGSAEGGGEAGQSTAACLELLFHNTSGIPSALPARARWSSLCVLAWRYIK